VTFERVAHGDTSQANGRNSHKRITKQVKVPAAATH
jgi:hypothetical protein